MIFKIHLGKFTSNFQDALISVAALSCQFELKLNASWKVMTKVVCIKVCNRIDYGAIRL